MADKIKVSLLSKQAVAMIRQALRPNRHGAAPQSRETTITAQHA